jgi:hypothetical protein
VQLLQRIAVAEADCHPGDTAHILDTVFFTIHICIFFLQTSNNTGTRTGSVSDPHWLSGSSILDECVSGSSADPDSGQIWTKFYESKQNKFFFIRFFSHLTFVYHVLCLKYDCIENSNFYNFFLVFRLRFSSFWGWFSPFWIRIQEPIECGSNADPDSDAKNCTGIVRYRYIFFLFRLSRMLTIGKPFSWQNMNVKILNKKFF